MVSDMTDIVDKLKALYECEEGEPDFAFVKEAIVEIKRLRNALHIIANDYVELSHDKVHWQRDVHMRTARKALAESYKDDISDEEPKPLDDDF